MPAATASQTIGPYWHLIEHKEWADLTRFGAEIPGDRIGAIVTGGWLGVPLAARAWGFETQG